MADKKNTRRLRLPVNAGVRTDGFAEDVPLLDINNYVLNPDGSAIRPREGSEIRRNDAVGVGVTRKSIYFMSNPPDIDGGDLLLIVSNKNGDRRIETSELVTAAEFEGATTYANSDFAIFPRAYPNPDSFPFFLYDDYATDATSADVYVRRTPSTGTSTVRVQTSDDTAIAGTDYVAYDHTFTFEDGDSEKTITLTLIPNENIADKNFLIEITDCSSGSGASGTNGDTNGAIYFRESP